MELWIKVWRQGLDPQMTRERLLSLKAALVADDPRLQQGVTTTPPPLACVEDWPVEGACLIGYAYWQGDGLKTVGEVEDAFSRCCYMIDEALDEPAACRWLLNWFDETPRQEMRAKLLAEVERTLEDRRGGVDAYAEVAL